jgi:hypothetical protein
MEPARLSIVDERFDKKEGSPTPEVIELSANKDKENDQEKVNAKRKKRKRPKACKKHNKLRLGDNIGTLNLCERAECKLFERRQKMHLEDILYASVIYLVLMATFSFAVTGRKRRKSRSMEKKRNRSARKFIEGKVCGGQFKEACNSCKSWFSPFPDRLLIRTRKPKFRFGLNGFYNPTKRKS